MSFQASPILIVLGGLAAFLLGIAVAVWSRRSIIHRIEGQCRALQAQLDNNAHALAAAVDEKQALEQELVEVRRELAAGVNRNEQLRDIVKVHVARRREFDEWAGPIKASLGEGVGQALRTLKDQLARQESVLQRQERLVAGTQDQYRAKIDEIERMRRELSIKNYHIAALNARFIRIEERIGDLGAQMSGKPVSAGSMSNGTASLMESADAPQPTERQLPPKMQERPIEEWSQLLDDWHKRLDQRFGEIDALQAGLRSPLGDTAAGIQRYVEVRTGGDTPTIQ